jgi:DNA-binding response OmpR family regulator
VTLHNGHISVASEEGIGSSFTVILPAYTRSPTDDRAPDHPWKNVKPATILLVEDEVHLLHGIRDLLDLLDSDYQLTILTASSGSEALAILKRHPVDLIISDIMMPGMDGYQFLAQVRKDRTLIHIPFIFLTAKSERQDVFHGLRSGVEEYITKPYNGQELFDLVVVQLDRHYERQGLIQSDFEELKRGILNVLLPGLRIPLEAVSEYSRKLAGTLNTAETEDDLLSQLSVIQAGSSQLTRLAEDFIFLAELQTGEARKSFKLRAEPGNAAAILDEVSREYNRKNEQSDLKFHRIIDLNLPMVNIDRQLLGNCLERLIEVVSNIGMVGHDDRLSDTITSQDKKNLTLSSSVDGNDVRLSVTIEKSQLDREDSDRIGVLLASPDLVVLELAEYDPGLMIVKGAVDLHSGWIFVENASEHGATFKIVLPAIMPELAQMME